MTTLYVAGPMRGYDQYNFPAFDAATECLRLAGYDVVSPAEQDRKIGFDPNSTSEFTSADYCAAMRRDIEFLLRVDGIALLPGWEDSAGAQTEVTVADAIGIPSQSVEDWLLMKVLEIK